MRRGVVDSLSAALLWEWGPWEYFWGVSYLSHMVHHNGVRQGAALRLDRCSVLSFI